MGRPSPKTYLNHHPESHNIIKFLLTYQDEWTVIDLQRDYPNYFSENNMSSLLREMRDANILLGGRYRYIPKTCEYKKFGIYRLWRLNTETKAIIMEYFNHERT